MGNKDKEKLQKMYEQYSQAERNLDDVRDLIKICNRISEGKDDFYQRSKERLEKEIRHRDRTIQEMVDKLVGCFKYLKNIKKMENFMRGKHDDGTWIILKMIANGKSFKEFLDLPDGLRQVGYKFRLDDYFKCYGKIEEELED